MHLKIKNQILSNMKKNLKYKVIVADFSLFSLPYDHYLCNSLSKLIDEVILIGRPLRKEENFPSSLKLYSFKPFFYKKYEKLSQKYKSLKCFIYYKGIEHLWNFKTFSKWVKRTNPHLIHFQWFVLPMVDIPFFYYLKKLCPLVLTLHNRNIFHGTPTHPLQTTNWQRILKYFDWIFVHTEESADEIRRFGYPPDRITKIQHPPFPIYCVSYKERKSKITFLIFGKIKPYKGIDVAIKAFSLLPQFVKEKVILKIAGKPYMDIGGLKKLTKELKIENLIEWDLRFIPDEELNKILCEADCFIFPYKEIDASGAFANVLSLEKPIIASNIGVFKEIMEKHKIGFLIEPDNPVALKDAILSFIEHREKITKNIKQNFKKLNKNTKSWDDIAEEISKIYTKLIKLKKFEGYK